MKGAEIGAVVGMSGLDAAGWASLGVIIMCILAIAIVVSIGGK